uniref:Uncharacterized protein n=1 Tax=Rangifer tarandus platyrhynchus TaxID=3082113 RepID=A0ACB0DW19_RANTA|nr:unnamed protein product [Rangifer tarandus platyrhynchus]
MGARASPAACGAERTALPKGADAWARHPSPGRGAQGPAELCVHLQAIMNSEQPESEKDPDEKRKTSSEQCFSKVSEDQRDNSNTSQMEMDAKTSSESIDNNQAEGPRDRTVSPEKTIYVTFDINIKQNKGRKHRLTWLYISTCRHVIYRAVGEDIESRECARTLGQCVKVTFAYEKAEDENKHCFSVERWFETPDVKLDYPVLKLKRRTDSKYLRGYTVEMILNQTADGRVLLAIQMERAARGRLPEPPPCSRSLSVATPGTVQKRRACEIARAGHEQWGAGGECLEAVIASWPLHWTWPSGASLSLEGTRCLPFSQWEE